jgi:hypothetical protein
MAVALLASACALAVVLYCARDGGAASASYPRSDETDTIAVLVEHVSSDPALRVRISWQGAPS